MVPPPASAPTNSQRRSRWRGSSPDDGSSSSSTGGPGEEADRDVHALLVAAGQGADLVVAAVREPGLLEHLLEDGIGVGHPLEAREEQQVLGHGQAPVERGLLRHPADLAGGAADLARVGVADPGEDREQRRLAGAVRADHGEQLAPVRHEGDVAQGPALAEALAQPLHLDHRLVARWHRGNARRGGTFVI